MIDRELLNRFTYVLNPGKLFSIVDNDTHYIGYAQLVSLWRIPRDRWISYEHYETHHFDIRRLIVLSPDYTGRYDLEAEIYKHLLELY